MSSVTSTRTIASWVSFIHQISTDYQLCARHCYRPWRKVVNKRDRIFRELWTPASNITPLHFIPHISQQRNISGTQILSWPSQAENPPLTPHSQGWSSSSVPHKTLLDLAPPNHTASPSPSPWPSLLFMVKRTRKKQQQVPLCAPGTCGQRDQQGSPGPCLLGTLKRRIVRLQHSCVCSRSSEGSIPCCSPFWGTKCGKGFAPTIRKNKHLRLRHQGIEAEVAGR